LDGTFEPRTLRQPFLNAVHKLSTGCDVENLEIKDTDWCVVAPLRRDGIAYSDARMKANTLNNQFTSLFTSEDPLQPLTDMQPFLNAVHKLSTGCDVENLEINDWQKTCMSFWSFARSAFFQRKIL
jgi:7,8-dihydro-6-hydroxymethylpterin-pyrophosphokinase